MAEEEVTNQEEEETGSTEEDNEEQQQPETVDAKEFAAVKKALEKANKEAAKFRHELKELRSKDESDSEKAAREAEERIENKYKKTLAYSEAKAELAAMGLNTKPERFLKMLELDEVSVTEDGEVLGLKDQLTQIKNDFPEVFKKKAPNMDAGKKAPPDDKPVSSAARIAAAYKGE